MTLIGIPINIFILFFKSFTLGFSLSSFIITYSYKGLLLSSIYLIIGQLINIIVLLVLTIYSIMFSSILIKNIFKNNYNSSFSKFNLFLKRNIPNAYNNKITYKTIYIIVFFLILCYTFNR